MGEKVDVYDPSGHTRDARPYAAGVKWPAANMPSISSHPVPLRCKVSALLRDLFPFVFAVVAAVLFSLASRRCTVAPSPRP